ncbi:MAG: hypothetical protein HKN51_08880, partial [Saprospiraceae bacterium]|nr:hypothetical protein [Saprospiraceae bacterium]
SKAIVERNEISMHLIPSFIELAQDEQASWQQVISLSSGLNKSLLSNTLMQGQTEMTEDVFNNETGLYGSSSDFSFGLENTNGWRFFAGVSYVTQHSSFEKHEKETSESLVPGTGSQINSAGVVQDVPVTLVEVKTTQYDLRWHRKHKYVDLNLGVGKTIARHGHLVFGLSSAINYNLSANHQGYYFANDAESAFTKFSADEENPYRDNMGLSLKMAMHVEWRHKMIGIGFSPFVQYRNNSILNSETFYKTSDNNIGVQLSLNIRPF